MVDYKRTAREIKVPDSFLSNKNINLKVGTVENREAPDTIYIFVSFWLQPKEEFILEEQDYLKEVLNKEIGNIYSIRLKPELEKNKFFTREKENIYIKNIPDSLNYNSKRNFISIELYLHTCNLFSEDKMPLSAKRDTELFMEAVRLGNIIGESEVIKGNSLFEVQRKSV